jgi:Flp pilus assembly protein TadG
MMSRLLQDRRGAVALEAAFVLPILFAMLLGMMEFGRMTWTSAALNYAVQEAARCASVRADVCKDAVTTRNYATQRFMAMYIPAASVAFTFTTPACGKQVRGEVAHSFLVTRVVPAAPKIAAQVCRP